MAEIKISELTEATSVDGSETLVIVASGTTKKVSIDNSRETAAEIEAKLDTYYGDTDWRTPATGTGEENVQSDWNEADTGSDAYILNKPATMTPVSHDNTYHSATYITSSGVTYENLSANSDIGTGATQVAQGDHTHVEADITDLGTYEETANKGVASGYCGLNSSAKVAVASLTLPDVIVSATEPTTRSDGTTLQTNDIWIDIS